VRRARDVWGCLRGRSRWATSAQGRKGGRDAPWPCWLPGTVSLIFLSPTGGGGIACEADWEWGESGGNSAAGIVWEGSEKAVEGKERWEEAEGGVGKLILLPIWAETLRRRERRDGAEERSEEERSKVNFLERSFSSKETDKGASNKMMRRKRWPESENRKARKHSFAFFLSPTTTVSSYGCDEGLAATKQEDGKGEREEAEERRCVVRRGGGRGEVTVWSKEKERAERRRLKESGMKGLRRKSEH
jgi:hypothetical protein